MKKTIINKKDKAKITEARYNEFAATVAARDCTNGAARRADNLCADMMRNVIGSCVNDMLDHLSSGDLAQVKAGIKN